MNLIRIAARNLLSIEALLVLLIFMGPLKHYLYWLPIDITLIVFALALGCSLLYLLQKYIEQGKNIAPPRLIACLTMISLCAYAAISLSWTAGNIYAAEKLTYFVTLTLVSFIIPVLIVSTSALRVKRFISLTIALGLLIAIDIAIAIDYSAPLRSAQQLDAGYLSIGRVVGISLVAVIMFLMHKYWDRNRVLGLGLAIILLWTLLIIGARGATLGLVAAAFTTLLLTGVYFAQRDLLIKRALLAVLILTSVCVLAFGIASSFYPQIFEFLDENILTFRRIMVLVSEGGDSAQLRMEFYKISLEIISASPVIGTGIGGWPVIAGFGDIRAYPHNIFIEISSELGLIGLFIFIILLITAARNIIPLSELRLNPLKACVVAMFIFALFNVNLTGDLHDNRFFFAMLGLLFFTSRDCHLDETCNAQPSITPSRTSSSSPCC